MTENAPPYAFRRVMRRRAIVAALLVSGGLFYIGLHIGAPAVILTLWGIATLALLIAVVVNRTAGVDIRDAVLTVTAGPRRDSYNLSEIVRVTASRWTDGPDEYALEMRDGARHILPAAAVPPGTALDDALREHGVAVESRRLKGTRA
ncbi:MAG: hypothetical protein RLZZ528_2977 [Pseudomonadota bacterium]